MNPVELVHRPLERPLPRGPAKRSQFRAGWEDTRKLLIVEAAHLDASLVVVEAAWGTNALTVMGLPKVRAVPLAPGVRVSFDSRHGPLAYTAVEYDDWLANVRAVALTLQALRAVDRYGAAPRGEQYAGWAQLGTGAGPSSMTIEQATMLLWGAIGLGPPPGFPNPTEVAVIYRAAAKRLHPDAGGDAEQFRRLTEARDLLLAPPVR